MNIVDSSGWLAYFADEPNAKHFLAPLSDSDLLVVPVITIYEIFKVILRESSENEALQAVVAMQKGKVVDLSTSLAIAASKLSRVLVLGSKKSVASIFPLRRSEPLEEICSIFAL